MTTATQATDNAVAAAAAERPDTRRITEADPDFQRLHAQTVRKLLASLRAYVRALRVEPASHHPQLATAYVRRQVGILRAAYAQAHREGVRDYYAAFSRRPGRYLHLAPSPAPHVVKRRLGFYAPSVAKMAHEALLAWGREQRAAAAAARLAESAAPEAHTGVMVAFMLAPQTAKKLAIVGGEPAEDMHITLAFLGEKTDMSGAQVQQLKRAVAGFAAEAMPLRARITGVDRFAGKPDDDTYPCFAAVDIPGIQRWRAQLVKYLKADGLPVDETFRDYHPHITLAYVPKGEPLPVKDVSHLSLLLDRLTLALGDERHTWRIGDEQYPDTSAAAASAKHAENITQAITLAGDPPANTGDFLDGIGPRVNLQAEITWSGFNDGYVDAGGTDPANPYTLLWWDLEPMAKHCFDCPPIAAGSPYDPPWVTGGNVLDATPGDGHTECGAACKCSLRYGAGAGEADPRGTVWDSPNAPPPPPAPDGQPGQWPNIAGVDDMSTLSEEQQRALQESFDAYRQAFERWEAIRGTLPSLPDMFGVAGGEGVAAAWPAWESLSPAQQVALKAVFDALAAYDAAAGSPTLEEVETGLAGNAASLDAIAQRAGALQDELNALVQAARAEEQQTKIDLFAGGPLKVLWQKFVHNLDQYFDWLLSRTEKFGEAAEDPAAGADAADDDGDAIRLYNPNHYPAGSRQGGQFAPKGGGGGGGDGGGLRARIGDLVARLRGQGGTAKASGHTELGHGARVEWGEHETTARTALRGMFGRDLAEHEVAALVGAREGDTVTIRFASEHNLELVLRGKDGAYKATRNVVTHYDKRGNPDGVVVGNASFHVYDSGKGVGTEVFARQVAALRDLGVREIQTRAERGGRQGVGIHGREDGYNGYYTWARLGYNADLRAHEFQSYGYRDRMPGWVKSARTIQDLMRIPAGGDHESGANWWREHGKGWDGKFDLTPNSRSIQVLRGYLEAKGMQIPGVTLTEHMDGDGEEIEWTEEDEEAADSAWERLNRQWSEEEARQQLAEDTSEDTSAAIRLYNPNHYPAGSRQGGQFAPRGGGGGIGGGEEEVHARGGGGGGGGAAHTTVTYQSEAHRASLDGKIGRAITPDDLAGLAGASHGVHIEVHHGLITSHAADGTTTTVGLTGKAADGDMALVLHSQARGEDHAVAYTAQQVHTMVATADHLGVQRMELQARAGVDNALLRYGFDCPIHEALHESRYHTSFIATGTRAPKPPHAFTSAHTLSEALAHEDARAWWGHYGNAPHLEFDMAPGSASRLRLEAALREESARTMADPRLDILSRPTVPEPDYSQADNAHGFRKLTKAERASLIAAWMRSFGPVPPWPAWADAPEPTDDDEDAQAREG